MAMMTATNGPQETWTSFRESAGGPGWLRELREAAWARFETLGFPQLDHEDWRFTDVSPIAQADFPLAPERGADLPAARIAELRYPELDGPVLVFSGGRFSPELSRIGELPDGVVVSSLASAIRDHGSLVQPHLGRLCDGDTEAFTQLNGAFLADGVFVHVPDDTVLPGAVHVILASGEAGETVTHPRVLFVLGESAQATVIEEHVGTGSDRGFSNSVTEIVVGANARGRHYFVERSNDDSYAVSTLYVEQQRDSDFASHSALLGGALVRNNVFPTLRGENCMSVLNGMYLPRGEQLHDNRMLVRHSAPHSESRQYYRGILDGRARAMFSGRIIVDKIAQRTDAVQSNKNLLLSPDAMAETKPQLEIYADDVKCTHGATTGQIDDEAIFYFRARGIPEEAARRLLVFAFVNEIFERMELAPVRDRLQAIVASALDARE